MDKNTFEEKKTLNPEMNPIETLKRNLEDAIRVIEMLRKENGYILKEKECLMGENYQLKLCLKENSKLFKKEISKLTAEANRKTLRLKIISLVLGIISFVLLILYLLK